MLFGEARTTNTLTTVDDVHLFVSIASHLRRNTLVLVLVFAELFFGSIASMYCVWAQTLY